ncbi:MAG TPA: YkgJ family cysteine cluster protein [Vicinamibacterales bacterium]
MPAPIRIDPDQRFSCSQCGRCCHRFDIVVSEAEIEHYRRRDAAAWFSGGGDPFEAVPEWPALRRIRKRADGACGFLSHDNRCRIHEELGASAKPLTCRLFPYAFHAAADGVVVTASFACPTIIANEGPLISSPQSMPGIDALRREWFSTPQAGPAPLEFMKGRTMDTRTARILRDGILAMLKQDAVDIRDNIARIAATLDDLTRPKVLALNDADFAEYVKLTIPHAATGRDAVTRPAPSRIADLLQYGFLYLVASTRAVARRRRQSRASLRVLRLQMLAHFHRLAPPVDGVDVVALKGGLVDINAPDIRPIVHHYLRSTFETLGARGLPVLDEIAIACSLLNATRALAVMNATASSQPVDRQVFVAALMETSDLTHVPTGGVVSWAMRRLGGGTEAAWQLTRTPESPREHQSR